jgi:hypothetical protein
MIGRLPTQPETLLLRAGQPRMSARFTGAEVSVSC